MDFIRTSSPSPISARAAAEPSFEKVSGPGKSADSAAASSPGKQKAIWQDPSHLRHLPAAATRDNPVSYGKCLLAITEVSPGRRARVYSRASITKDAFSLHKTDEKELLTIGNNN